MKSRIIKSSQDRTKAVQALMTLDFPYVITISEDKLRSTSQNSRYWATMDEYLGEITGQIDIASSHTGHTQLEIRKLIASTLSPEKAAILFATNKEVVHHILKYIVGCPTSTRLGTKRFMEFETIMESQMMEIIGDVNDYVRKIL